MARTSHISTKDCSVVIWNSAGASLAVSGHGNTVDIDVSVGEQEATSYGDNWHEYEPDLVDFTINYSGWWAGSHATDVTQSAAACLLAIVASQVGGTIRVYPAGSTAGSLAYTACVNFTAFPVSFPRDGFATMAFTCRPRSGSLTCASA